MVDNNQNKSIKDAEKTLIDMASLTQNGSDANQILMQLINKVNTLTEQNQQFSNQVFELQNKLDKVAVSISDRNLESGKLTAKTLDEDESDKGSQLSTERANPSDRENGKLARNPRNL